MFALQKNLQIFPHFYISIDPKNLGGRYFYSKEVKKISSFFDPRILIFELHSARFIGNHISQCPLYF